MARKTAAQIRRLQKRAEARGEVYVAPPRPPPRKREDAEDGSKKKKQKIKKTNNNLHAIAKRLEKELREIDDNPDLTSKERRSAKRKAEAVAAEAGEMSRTDFLEWCKTKPDITEAEISNDDDQTKDEEDPKASAQLAVVETDEKTQGH